jgi:protein SCO1/2
LLILIVILSLNACRPRAREYPVHGQVIAIALDRGEVTLKHDDIPGFMPAMIMPYRVQDPSALSRLAPGDVVTATLVVPESNVPVISTINKTGHLPLAPDTPAPHVMNVMEPGDTVPDEPLQDSSGTNRRLSDWRGQAVAVTFIYTRCPLPDFCPLMERQFAEVQRAVLADAALRDRVHLIAISFDPEHDTPRILAAHARQIGANPHVWTFLTGSTKELDIVTSRFGVSVVHEKDAAETFTHNLRTAVIDARGRLVKIYNGHEWTPAALLTDLRDARATR